MERLLWAGWIASIVLATLAGCWLLANGFGPIPVQAAEWVVTALVAVPFVGGIVALVRPSPILGELWRRLNS